jgi:hypothetical protein
MTSRAATGASELAERVPVASTQRTVFPLQGLAAARGAKRWSLPVIGAPIRPERHVPNSITRMRPRLAMRSTLVLNEILLGELL